MRTCSLGKKNKTDQLFSLTKKTSEKAALYQNDVFSILVCLTKKQYSNFLKKVLFFQKDCFTVRILQIFRTSSDCRVKICQYLQRMAISKFSSTVFRRTYALFILK